MEITLKILFDASPVLADLVKSLVSASEGATSPESRVTASEAPIAEGRKRRTHTPSAKSAAIVPASEPQQEAPSSEASKEPQPEPAEPVSAEAAPASDLPFAAETGEGEPAAAPERPEMSLGQWKALLADTQKRLLLGEGEENFSHKREFVTLVRSIAKYYGADKPAALTPANLYYCAQQVSSIQIADGKFTADEPSITPEQVVALSKPPY